MLLRSVCIAALLSLAGLSQASDQSREALQFKENAKIAGRTLACGDRAGYASLRAASRPLAGLLRDEQSVTQRMEDFDKRARLQRRFADRASDKHRRCQQIAEKAQDSLRYTQLIAPSYPEPED